MHCGTPRIPGSLPNHWVLQAAWQYKQQYGASAYEESDKKKAGTLPIGNW